MDPGLARHHRCYRFRLHRRRDDPLLLRPRPPSAPLNRCDHLDLRLRHRTIPRISPITPQGSLAPAQGGGHRRDTVVRLNTRCFGPHRDGVKPLLLTPTRPAAERYNRDGLMALGTERVGFRARVDGKFPITGNNLPAPEYLELAIGARVMTVKNDAQGRWVNGSVGTVTRIIEDGAFVVFDRSRQEHLVSRVSWENISQRWNNTQRRIENKSEGAYRQIPLVHAWAVTIHKAQGLTLDDVRVDLGPGAFAPGQVYVALSRVRTMSGLSFARPLRPADVQAEPMLLEFMKWVQSEHLH
jgi:ATP-dependent DNA helicase PIF1